MDICRLCLSGKAKKDVTQLKTSKKDGNKDYSEILQFCLDIQVTEDSCITRKLCTPCVKKTLTFYQFKCMALKNDSYLRSTTASLTQDGVKIEPFGEREGLLDVTTPCEEVNTDDLKKERYLATEVNNTKNNVKTEYDEKSMESQIHINIQLQEDNAQYEEGSRETHDSDVSETEENYDETALVDLEPKNVTISTRNCQEKEGKKHCKSKKEVQSFLGYPCKFCDRIFRSMSVRRRHVKFTHEGVNGHCDLCNKNVKHLKNHINLMHDHNQLKFECDSCGKRYVTKYRLKYHACHKRERNFTCSECNKKFWCPRELDRHIRSVHEGEKSFLCQFCSKSFFRKSHLVVHLRSHTKEKPYKCKDCDKSFSTCTGLKQHQYTHTDRHDFQCSQCAKTFAGPKYLYTHMLTHSKERKYPCKYCGVSFVRSDTRKTHENNVHEKNITNLL